MTTSTPGTLLACLIAAIPSVSLAALPPIDDFSSGPGFQAEVGDDFDGNNFGRFEGSLDTRHTIGGGRLFRVQSCLRSGEGFLPVVHNPVLGTLRVGGTPESVWCEGISLRYGGQINELNLDLELLPTNGIEIVIDSFDAGGPTFWEAGLRLSLGTVYERVFFPGTEREFSVTSTATHGHRVAIEPSFENSVLFVPFTAFSGDFGNFSLSDIDEIGIDIGPGGPGAEIVIREIRFAVPEPTSASLSAILAVNLTAFLRRTQRVARTVDRSEV